MSEHQPDYARLAATYLGGSEAAELKLRACLDEIARWQVSVAAHGRGAPRRDELQALRKQVASLARRLGRIDPTTRARIMLGFDPLDQQDAGPTTTLPGRSLPGISRITGVESYRQLLELLERCEAGLRWCSTAEPVRRVGRERRDECLMTGVEWLASIWRAHREDEPTQSTKRGGFGAFATEVLTAAPFQFNQHAVRHAVAEVLPGEQPSDLP